VGPKPTEGVAGGTIAGATPADCGVSGPVEGVTTIVSREAGATPGASGFVEVADSVEVPLPWCFRWPDLVSSVFGTAAVAVAEWAGVGATAAVDE
jgi:hypothetical protein